jgi:hypothetical protein
MARRSRSSRSASLSNGPARCGRALRASPAGLVDHLAEAVESTRSVRADEIAFSSIGGAAWTGSPTRADEAASSRSPCSAWLPGAGETTTRRLGDQGLPMATAVAAAGFELHAWARRPASMDALGDAPHVRHPPLAEIRAMLQPLHPRPARSPARMSSAHKLPRDAHHMLHGRAPCHRTCSPRPSRCWSTASPPAPA